MIVKYFKLLLMASLLSQPVVSHSDAPDEVLEVQVDVNSLSQNERDSLQKMDIVRLVRLNYQNEVLGKVEKYVGYSSIKKNLLGFCVFNKYFFDDLSLIEPSHERVRYVGFVDSECKDYLSDGFVALSSVPEITARDVFAVFEKGKAQSGLDGTISFASEMSLSLKEKKAFVKRLSTLELNSISYSFIPGLDIGCYLIAFYGSKDKVELYANFTSSVINVIGIKDSK